MARVLLLTGEGKGKTTAALGIILRCVGAGKRVVLVRFCKARSSGELSALQHLPGVRVLNGPCGRPPPVADPAWVQHRAAAQDLWGQARSAAVETECVVLDEACLAAARGLLDAEEVAQWARTQPADHIVVLTGRGAVPELIAAADTVSNIVNIKHGLDAGIAAQPGVET